MAFTPKLVVNNTNPDRSLSELEDELWYIRRLCETGEISWYEGYELTIEALEQWPSPAL
jgi:hypothetical protein